MLSASSSRLTTHTAPNDPRNVLPDTALVAVDLHGWQQVFLVQTPHFWASKQHSILSPDDNQFPARLTFSGMFAPDSCWLAG